MNPATREEKMAQRRRGAGTHKVTATGFSLQPVRKATSIGAAPRPNAFAPPIIPNRDNTRKSRSPQDQPLFQPPRTSIFNPPVIPNRDNRKSRSPQEQAKAVTTPDRNSRQESRRRSDEAEKTTRPAIAAVTPVARGKRMRQSSPERFSTPENLRSRSRSQDGEESASKRRRKDLDVMKQVLEVEGADADADADETQFDTTMGDASPEKFDTTMGEASPLPTSRPVMKVLRSSPPVRSAETSFADTTGATSRSGRSEEDEEEGEEGEEEGDDTRLTEEEQRVADELAEASALIDQTLLSESTVLDSQLGIHSQKDDDDQENDPHAGEEDTTLEDENTTTRGDEGETTIYEDTTMLSPGPPTPTPQPRLKTRTPPVRNRPSPLGESSTNTLPQPRSKPPTKKPTRKSRTSDPSTITSSSADHKKSRNPPIHISIPFAPSTSTNAPAPTAPDVLSAFVADLLPFPNPIPSISATTKETALTHFSTDLQTRLMTLSDLSNTHTAVRTSVRKAETHGRSVVKELCRQRARTKEVVKEAGEVRKATERGFRDEEELRELAKIVSGIEEVMEAARKRKGGVEGRVSGSVEVELAVVGEAVGGRKRVEGWRRWAGKILPGFS